MHLEGKSADTAVGFTNCRKNQRKHPSHHRFVEANSSQKEHDIVVMQPNYTKSLQILCNASVVQQVVDMEGREQPTIGIS